jgi:hypothetical protein
MSPSKTQKRAIRIAGCSGGFTDRSMAITRMAGDPDVDVVMGNIIPPCFCDPSVADRVRRLAL